MTIQLTISPRAVLLGAALLALLIVLPATYAITSAEDGASSDEPRAALGNGFTLQGRFEQDGVPANGTFAFRFTLQSDAAANAPVGSTISQNVAVVDGVFSTLLDFGAGAFDGNARWIAIEVNPGSGFVSLPPRQALTPAPYALFSQKTGPHTHVGENWVSFLPITLTISNNMADATTLYIQANGNNSTAIVANNGCSSTPGYCYGLVGKATFNVATGDRGGVGVRGEGSNTGISAKGGLYGLYAEASDGTAIQAISPGGTGIYVESGAGDGIYAAGTATGVYGEASTEYGRGLNGVSFGTSGIGVYGNAVAGGAGVVGISSAGVGVRGEGGTWAGDFTGSVRASGTVRADDVLPRQEACTSGCYVGDLVKPWTGMYANNYTTVSDARKKQDITGLPYGLAEILALRPVSYSFIDDETGKTRLGLIAQEVEQVMPEVVTPPASEEAFYAMSYDDLIPVLINAIKEQQAEIEVLKAAIGID